MKSGDRLFNRELSWIEFNSRVLDEGVSPQNPPLERLKFIGIVSSNFDEFFMVRAASYPEPEPILEQIYAKSFAVLDRQTAYFAETLVPELERCGIRRQDVRALKPEALSYLRDLFDRQILPLLTPVALHPEHPPTLSNLALYLAVGLADAPGGEVTRRAVVEIPKNYPRLLSLPSSEGGVYSFVLLEDVVSLFAGELFRGFEVIQTALIRLTRGAEMTIDEEKDADFALVMREALTVRRTSHVVRAEMNGEEPLQEFLIEYFSVPKRTVYRQKTWFDLKTVSGLAFRPMFDHLKLPEWKPKPIPESESQESVWDLLKKEDVFLHHPYESFDFFVNWLRIAADDPDVLAIKQTLYRASADSAVITALERAASKGKRVTVLVELKARFDEEANIEWARRLERAGASVIYGVTGLKTHAKACLVVRREAEGMRRYAHLSTGNYNEKTARIYSDIGYLTSREELTSDITSFFNVISGFSQPVGFKKVEMAPFRLRKRIVRLIQRESLRSSKERPGHIIAKMNSLADPEVIEELYKASQNHVKIQLNVRGICCLKPGVPGLSENIEVRSIVDMFLEHSRIFYFGNGGEEEIYLSSADWMPRNFDRRIELLFPIEGRSHKQHLKILIKNYFKENTHAWRLKADGAYERLSPGAEKPFRIQEFLCRRASDRIKNARQRVPNEIVPKLPKHQTE